MKQYWGSVLCLLFTVCRLLNLVHVCGSLCCIIRTPRNKQKQKQMFTESFRQLNPTLITDVFRKRRWKRGCEIFLSVLKTLNDLKVGASSSFLRFCLAFHNNHGFTVFLGFSRLHLCVWLVLFALIKNAVSRETPANRWRDPDADTRIRFFFLTFPFAALIGSWRE